MEKRSFATRCAGAAWRAAWTLSILSIGVSMPPALAAKGLSEENLQLEFCVTYLPCQIAVGVMDTAVEIEQRRSLISSFFKRFGQMPARSEKEYREWLSTINPTERQRLVDRCTDVRGKNMLDWCESSYLLEGEISAQRPPQRPPLTDADVARFGGEQIKLLRAEDENLLAALKLQCRIVDGRLSELCATNVDLVRQMQLGEQAFNENARYRDVGLSFQSEAVLFFKRYFEWKERDRMWIPRPVEPEAWTLLPGDTAKLPNVRSRSIVEQPPDVTGFVDPFAGTSKRLEPASIEAQRREFQREQASARRFTEALGVIAQAALEQRNLQQALRAQPTAPVGPRTLGQRIYSDDPAKQHFPSPDSDQNRPETTSRAVTECVIAEPSSTGSGALQLRNTCNFAVEVGWCVVGLDCKNGGHGFSNQWSLRPGASYPISGSKGRQVSFGACTPANSSITSVSSREINCK